MILRSQHQMTARPGVPGKFPDERPLIGDVGEHLQSHHHVKAVGTEVQSHEITRDKSSLWRALSSSGKRVIRQIGSGHTAKLGQSWAKPARTAADFNDVEIRATERFQPFADHLGLPLRGAVEHLLGIKPVPPVPEALLQRYRFDPSHLTLPERRWKASKQCRLKARPPAQRGATLIHQRPPPCRAAPGFISSRRRAPRAPTSRRGPAASPALRRRLPGGRDRSGSDRACPAVKSGQSAARGCPLAECRRPA